MADKGEIRVKILMFPLQMHKGAREQCVAVVCDKKSFDDLENGYKSDNQCAEGAKLVDETIALLSSKGIYSTPTYLFSDGRFRSGLAPDTLRKQLGIPVPAASPPASAAPPTPPAAQKKPPAAPVKKPPATTPVPPKK